MLKGITIRHPSLQERDRRWKLIRGMMQERGLDCLIIRSLSAKWDSQSANVRYVCQIGGNGEEGYAVFPLTEDPTCFVWHPAGAPWWRDCQSWTKDVREVPGRFWSDSIVARIKELDLGRARIGLVGLGATDAEPEGVIPYHTFRNLKEGLPEAQFEEAEDMFKRCRWIKSSEEIAFIEEAAKIADKAIETMARSSRVGVKDYQVYADMVHTMLSLGSEPPMLIWEAGPSVFHATRLCTGRELEKGDIILNEISPRVAGYFAHPHQPVAIGEPSKEYREMFDLAVEAFHRGFPMVKPGITIGELDRIFMEPIQKAGYIWRRPTIHGVGLEIPEAPRSSPVTGFWRPPYTHADTFVEAGMVLAIQPMVGDEKKEMGIPIGDTVVVTEKGPRRLSKRELGLIVV